MDGHIWGFDQLNNLNNFDFHISSDNFSLRKLIWPVGITGILYGALTLINIIYTILGTLKTNEGEDFTYPITIKFIK